MHRRPRLVAVVLGAALLLPLVVVAARVLLDGAANPGGDNALIELRVRDVGGSSTPLLGSYGRYGFNQPGPGWFYVLALPYRLLGSGYGGLQAGVVVVNAVAVAAMLLVVHRRGGPVATALVAALLGVLVRGLGPLWLANPWEPHGLTLLTAALLLLAFDAALGGVRSLAAAVVVAAVLAGAQASLAPYAATLAAVAVGGALLRLRLRRRRDEQPAAQREVLRALAVGGGLAVLLWLPPLLALVRHDPGNLADLLRSMRRPPAPALGFGDAWRAVAAELGPGAPWLGGQQPLEPFSPTVDLSGVPPVPLGLVALVVAGAVAIRRRSSAGVLVAIVGAGLVAGVASLARLLGPLFFWIPEWTRVLGFGCALAVAWCALDLLRARWPDVAAPVLVPLLAAATAALAVATTVDALDAELPANPSVLAVHRLAEAAIAGGGNGTVLVTATRDLSALLGEDPGLPTLVLDLERAGQDVVVEPALEHQYGARRADPGRATRELRLLTEADEVPDGFRVVARQDPLSEAERAERTRLLAEHPELGALGPAERLQLVDAQPELRGPARRLGAIPDLPVLVLVARPLPPGLGD